MEYELVIKNGQVILEDRVIVTDIGINQGKIEAIEETLTGEQSVDASGLIVSPGMFDAHVHITENGNGVRDDWEGYITGTSACAKGGVTSFLEMPLNQLPATTDKASFQNKILSGQDKLKVDVYSFGGLVPYNLTTGGIEELNQAGVKAFKAFLATAGDPELENDFQNIDDYTLYEGMKQIAKTGKILAIHAENAAVTNGLEWQARRQGKTLLSDYVATRPPFTEVEAIQRAILFAKETNCRIHICHVATPKGVEAVIQGREQGVDVSCETCLHYLYFTIDQLDDIGMTAKCSPPIRDKTAQDGLWDYLEKGEITSIVSDHSPCPPELKEKSNAFDAWGGIAGVQNNVDLFFDQAVQKRGMSLVDFAQIIAAKPCERFGIKEKGSITIGKDADFVLIDPNASYVLKAQDLEYRHQISPYIGSQIDCQVAATFVRGNEVYNRRKGVLPDFKGEFK